MSAPNGVARRAFQQAGRPWRTEPIVMHDAAPAVLDEGLAVVRDPAATEQPAPVAIPSAPTAMRLHADLLHSMFLVGFGIALGYGTALLVVFLNGRG